MLAGTVAGVATSTYAPLIAGERVEDLREFTRRFLELPRPQLALAIFINNGLKTLGVIVFGVLGGVLPLVFLLINGYVLGLVLHAAIRTQRASEFFLAIVPHGVLELPAVLLGTSIGLMLGVSAIRRWRGKEERPLGPEIARGLRFFAAVIVPLLLFAALIEAFITAALAGK